VFIVEHCLASRSYLTYQNEFRDTFTDCPVPNKSTIPRLVNRFRDTGTLHRVASKKKKRVIASTAERGGHFQHFILHCFFSDFNVIYV
jgi:Fe2+ or Zn2+ uptake regulation protein